jgi:UDP-N-acetylmuramyl pentapeptide phosphotransferase/UDP-N-acetylglucosamine-1-phosphate transferase
VILDLIGGAAISAVVSIIACRILIAAGPLAVAADARHLHRAPTPTSGGLGIALGFGVGLMVLALASHAIQVRPIGVTLLTATAGFAYGLLALGFWDDAHPLSARLKFLIFGLLSLAAAASLGAVGSFVIGDAQWLAPYWLALAGTALWVFTLVNAVNFMDGANGLSMGSVAIGMIWLCTLGVTHGDGTGSGAIAAACTAGALIGFLLWNFPHARLFAGDSGALFVGGLAALTSLLVIHRTGLSPVVPAIIFFPLLADVLLTLAWRVIRRRSLLDGHSEHLYQIAIHGGMSHAAIALIYWAAMAACGVIAFLAARDPGAADWQALSALAIIATIVSIVGRQYAARRGIGGV